MKYFTVFTVVIVIALFNTPIQSNDESEDLIPSESLECYACSNCPKISINTTSKLCPPSGNGGNLTCITYMERISFLKRRGPLVVRGCSSEHGTCAEIQEVQHMHKDVIEMVFCTECSSNNCNSNSGVNRLGANLINVYFIVVIMISISFFLCISSY